MSKLEKKIGRYAIHNLTMFLIGAYAVGYAIMYMLPGILSFCTLEPGLILQGQIWRILTWVLVPPGGNIFTIIIMMFFYYSIGSALEQAWGAFRYNLYIFGGIIFTVIGAFLLYFIFGGIGVGMYFSTYYINLSIFLAFAASYPDMEVRLYFVLPIKIKWMGWVYVAYIVYTLAIGNAAIRIAIVASLLNFVVFYFSGRHMQPYRPKEMARKAKYKKETQQARESTRYENGARHRCATCGRTELDDPTLEFRFCSKCKGNYEYCQDHLFTHEHVK